MTRMVGTNNEVLRDFLHQLRDFGVKASDGPCFLYELSEDKHREAMDVIKELTEAGVITGGYKAFAVMGDEITPFIEFCSGWTAIEFHDRYYVGRDNSLPSLEEDMLVFNDWREDNIIDIVDQLNGVSPEEWDEQQGTNFAEQIYRLQNMKTPDIIGLEVDWARDKAFVKKNHLEDVVKDPLRYGFKVTSVDMDKLMDLCRKRHLKLPKAPQQRRVFAALSFSSIMQPCVFMDGRKYIGTGLNDGSRAAETIEYIKDGQRFGKEVTVDELLDNKVLSSKKNISLKTTIFRHNPFNIDRDDERPAPLAPFAVVLRSDAIRIDTKIMLTADEAELIKQTFKRK